MEGGAISGKTVSERRSHFSSFLERSVLIGPGKEEEEGGRRREAETVLQS